MGYLFFDIESFVAPQNERSGLNPHFDESEVIVISYNYYKTPKAPREGEIKEATFLYGWIENGEKTLLKKFWEVLEEIYEQDRMLKVVGFNQLAYDLPYLFARMKANKIASDQKLFDSLFSFPRHVDLAQLGMAISEDTKREEDFRCISQKRINSYFDIPIKEAGGKDVSEFYIKKRYDLIEKYVKEEFTFELLYQSVLDYFIYVK
jgi:DNA polymerase elongation subunit (family B)